MAKPSKQRPWIVEMWPKAHGTTWVVMDAYRDEDTAEANAALMRGRVPFADFRVRDVRESCPSL